MAWFTRGVYRENEEGKERNRERARERERVRERERGRKRDKETHTYIGGSKGSRRCGKALLKTPGELGEEERK